MSFSNIIPVICESVGARLKARVFACSPLSALLSETTMTKDIKKNSDSRIGNIKALVVMLLCFAASGCDNAETLMPDYDFSDLGSTPIDGVLRQDVIKNFDFYGYTRDIVLPQYNPLVKDIAELLKANGVHSASSAGEIEKLGASCAWENEKEICTYQGTIITRYHRITSPAPDLITEYYISIYPSDQSVDFEILRKTHTRT